MRAGRAGVMVIAWVPDDQLVRKVAERDQAALEELYRRHRPGMLALCFRVLGDWHAAEEALQDTMVTVWQRAAGFEGRSTGRAWLYAIARNHALNRRRQRRLPTSGTAELAAMPADDKGPEELAVAAAQRAELATALDELPSAQREILTLTFIAGLSHAETAGVLGVAVGTVKSRLHRAKRALAARLTSPDKEVMR